eukprot:5972244-Pleurochrysis_carterae.AAC.6
MKKTGETQRTVLAQPVAALPRRGRAMAAVHVGVRASARALGGTVCPSRACLCQTEREKMRSTASARLLHSGALLVGLRRPDVERLRHSKGRGASLRLGHEDLGLALPRLLSLSSRKLLPLHVPVDALHFDGRAARRSCTCHAHRSKGALLQLGRLGLLPSPFELGFACLFAVRQAG